jgi:protein Tex
MIEKHLQLISQTLSLPERKVQNTVALLMEGATIPFISRYRKEATGSLDEVQIGAIKAEHKKLEELEKRRETVLASIEEQGKLTPELKARIERTYDPVELEDIYLPYKKKRKTKATVAKEKGLEPLANAIFQQNNQDIESLAFKFITDEVPDIDEALQGARDIIAEWINEDENARNKIRAAFKRGATIRSKIARGKEEEAAKYRDYFDFEESLHKCPSHRLLAIRRGEEEGLLRVQIGPDEEEAIYQLEKIFIESNGSSAQQIKEAIKDSYKRLLSPSIETEFRNMAKDIADEEAINVFTENLRQLLLAPPLGQKSILALDPGFRTGCKVVCIDQNGDLLYNTTIYPHPPQNQSFEAMDTIKTLVDKYNISTIAVGNGTAGRETMALAQKIRFDHPVEVYLVSENGASIYSASAIAREEFPDKDVTVRGAVSIGRRLMDPLAELVKIDPKSIGVGQYQHDVNQTKLKESLDTTVESCVNSVGINLNTASKHLLTYVSGLGPTLAKNIIEYRSENGSFNKRSELKKVPRMGDKAFEQCAGFLRVKNSKNPLDNTAVHPESYPIAEKMAKDLNATIKELIENGELRKQINLKNYVTETTGLPTLNDIVKELAKPGLDPRGEAKTFSFKEGVNTIGDIEPGMVLPGIVTNVTKFGAFVDIGIKEGGLVHISQLSDTFVKDPADVVKLQQEVRVKVMEVDAQRGRISLSMKGM